MEDVDSSDEEDADIGEEAEQSTAAGAEFPGREAAVFRQGLTRTATDIDIKIGGCRLYLLFSTKFRFISDTTELSSPTASPGQMTLSSPLERNRSFRDGIADRVPELIAGVESLPPTLYVSKLQVCSKSSARMVRR